ncbi:MAG: MerR family DNA-binding transcriptional regulator [Solirubrobacteraceae bacterium]
MTPVLGLVRGPCSSAMRYLKTTEAATLLDVGPSTLRAWERRFGFPQAERSPGGHRCYPHGEIVALRSALEDGLSISSAVARARAALAADTHSLVAALLAYDEERADRAIETTLALRSVERSVEEVMLPGLERIVGRLGADSAVWAFSARWAADWLRRAKRLAPSPAGRTSIVLVNASRDELDLDAAYIRTLKLFCLRAGAAVLMLPARARSGIGDAVLVHQPQLVVLAGKDMDETTITRWTHAVGRSIGPRPVALYRPGGTPIHNQVLPPGPSDAQLRLLELVEAADSSFVRQLAS